MMCDLIDIFFSIFNKMLLVPNKYIFLVIMFSDWSEYIDTIIDKWTKLVHQITTFPFPFLYSI